MKCPKILYHFTSLENIPSIISHDKKIHLRSTNINYLNDPNEFAAGLKIHVFQYNNINPLLAKRNIKAALIEFSKFIGDIYITSFSESRDKLEMWNLYGKSGNGVVLGFLSNKLLDNNSFDKEFIKCAYNKNDFKLESNNFWENHGEVNCDNTPYSSKDTSLIRDLPFSCARYKHFAYEYEKEWRLCFLNEEFYGNVKYPVFNKISHGGELMTYIENTYPLEALISITIGPTANYKKIHNTLESYLKGVYDDKKINNIQIKKSSIKFRNI
ncbi:MAG TPA: DUF2971 domain-containing protein [Candidatus Egerieousia sp.]|mgnify:CR=1 FL=1|nr:DUF2971 domain-containing protein [Candidatus Egerieousia sp.]